MKTEKEVYFTQYVRSGQKLLRCGYTTGTCAALAAAGAARLLLTGCPPQSLGLTTPKGLFVEVPLAEAVLTETGARAAVVKDGGDDADATDGYWIVAQVSRIDGTEILVDGGEGVGRVTRPGLDQSVGAAAINRVPRQMIAQAVEREREAAGEAGGLLVEISVLGGAELAKKTFNPQLGIVGGISILGTSGIVEPMSRQAIVDTIALEQRQAAAGGAKRMILTPGNYGEDFIRDQGLDGLGAPCVKCSNFIGEALDIAAAEGFAQLLLVGHAGKLVKLAGGIMNTHSRWADCRVELLCAHAAVHGAGQALCRQLMEAATTDAALALLEEAGLQAVVLDSLLAAVQGHLERRAAGAFRVGAVIFTNEKGFLGQTAEAEKMIKEWKHG